MPRLRIATWNIRKAVGLDRRRDPDRILHVIAALGADVVALQEADYRLGDRPSVFGRGRIEAATSLVPVEVGGARSLGWHGNAILVSEETEVEEVVPIALPGLEPRGALLADVILQGRPLRVVATHLGLMRRHRQDQQAAIVAAISDQPARPTVILGDLNEWSPTRGLGPLRAGYRVHAPGRSYHAARPVAALDRIAVSPTLEVERGGVTHTELTRMASDHLPVWVDLAPR